MEYLYYLKSLFFADPLTKACVAIACTILLNVFGANWVAYEALFILVTLDTITGFMVAVGNKTVSSARFFKTGKKLIVYFTLILAAHQVVRTSPMTEWLDPAMALGCAITELISIIENANKLGVPIPKWISEKLESYRHPQESSSSASTGGGEI